MKLKVGDIAKFDCAKKEGVPKSGLDDSNCTCIVIRADQINDSYTGLWFIKCENHLFNPLIEKVSGKYMKVIK